MVVLYTPMPMELIFPSDADDERRYIQQQGRLLEVEAAPDNKMRIVRLISTDPQDYLDAGLQPGTLI